MLTGFHCNKEKDRTEHCCGRGKRSADTTALPHQPAATAYRTGQQGGQRNAGPARKRSRPQPPSWAPRGKEAHAVRSSELLRTGESHRSPQPRKLSEAGSGNTATETDTGMKRVRRGPGVTLGSFMCTMSRWVTVSVGLTLTCCVTYNIPLT